MTSPQQHTDRNSLALAFLALSILLSFTAMAKPVLRGAFDIGSGTTKLKVAWVEPAETKILQIVVGGEDFELPVPYISDLKSTKTKFSQKIRERGIQAILSLKQKAADALQAKGITESIQYRGIATSAFRKAQALDPKGTGAFLQEIFVRTGVKASVAVQEKEGILGFWAATFQAAKLGMNPEDLVVWDIGGSSMQLISITADKAVQESTIRAGQYNLLVYGSGDGAVPFKMRALSIEGRPSDSPNPIGKSDGKVIRWAARNSGKRIPTYFKKALRSGKTMVGIGSLHKYCILGQTGKKDSSHYSRRSVRKAALQRLSYDDLKLAQHNAFGKLLPAGTSLSAKDQAKVNKKMRYAASDVSNLVLVEGIMKELGVSKVEVLDVTLSEGVLVAPTLWN